MENEDVLKPWWVDMCSGVHNMACVSAKFLLYMYIYACLGFSMFNSYQLLYCSKWCELFMLGYSCDACAMVKILASLDVVWLSFWFNMFSAC
jgi:hypothetical protein